MTTTRRSFLGTAAGIGSAAALADWALVHEALAHAAEAVAQQPPPRFTHLTADEGRELAAIAERIVPTTNTPGAREAGAVFFMDKAFGTFEKAALPVVKKGLAELPARVAKRQKGAKSFAALPVADQDAILIDLESGEFFGAVRYLTMVGVFGNPSHGGNRGGVGWKLIGFEPKPSHAPPFGYYDAQLVKRGKS